MRQTFRYDCMRGPFNSIVYTGLMTLAILIAKRYYLAPDWVKSFIASAESIGRLVTPITLYIGFRLGLRTSLLAALYMFGTGILLMGTAISMNTAFYAVTIVAAYILFAQPPKLMLHIYSNNYPTRERGKRVSTMFTISIGVGILFSFWLGKGLDADITNFHMQFFLLAIAAIISALFLMKIPSVPLDPEAKSNAWQTISLLWKDKLFAIMIVGYIILGVGNSMVIPIRIEYMADPKYTINASNLDITVINVVIQGASMIISTRIWGYTFDKLHFITTRLLVNACFFISFVTFFTSKNLLVLGVSIAVNGFAMAGGMILWNLWVTKIAPHNKIPVYMSAHSACSGVKGLIAPFIGYAILALTGPKTVGFIAAGLMVLSSAIYYSLRKNPRIQ